MELSSLDDRSLRVKLASEQRFIGYRAVSIIVVERFGLYYYFLDWRELCSALDIVKWELAS